MWAGILIALVLVATASGDDCKCSSSIEKYYSELGCTPVKEGGACCATKYNCGTSVSGRSQEKCYLKGKAYGPGARLDSVEAGNPCVPECRCSKYGPQASFVCAHNDCPELFQGQIAENCVRLYAQGTCCSTGTHCGDSSSSTLATKDSNTCQYGGKSYVFGQKFYPKEHPCKSCICQKGFDGTLNGPWCTEVSCGIELHYGTRIAEGCAPIHFGQDGCCPIGWRCPATGDSVVRSASKKKATTTATCTFGALNLSVGDKLSKEKQCVECACAVPPHVTCVQKGYC